MIAGKEHTGSRRIFVHLRNKEDGKKDMEDGLFFGRNRLTWILAVGNSPRVFGPEACAVAGIAT